MVFPLRSPLIRSKLCPFIILGTWIAGVAVISPHFFTYQLVEYSEEMKCVTRWKKAFGESSSIADYLLAGSILFTYIPVMLLIILYSIILIKLKTRAHPGEQSANIQQQRNRRNRNVLQLSIAIVLVFVLCWLPYTTNILIKRYTAARRSTHFSCAFWLYDVVTIWVSGTVLPIRLSVLFLVIITDKLLKDLWTVLNWCTGESCKNLLVRN